MHGGRDLLGVELLELLKTAKNGRLHALSAVALGLGPDLCRGEALGLRWADVDLDVGVLSVRPILQRVSGRLVMAPPKTRRSRRSIPLPEQLVDALRAHKETQAEEWAEAGAVWHDSGLVFTTRLGTPIKPNDFSKAFVRLCAAAGVRRVRLHDLRHTCASMLLAQGVPPRVVMEILGHSTLDVTMNVHGHVMLDAHRASLESMGSLLE